MSIEKVTLSNGHTVEIYQSEDNENPRIECDNFSHVILFGKYRGLGDKHDIVIEKNYNDRYDFAKNAIKEVAKQFKDVAVILPVHVYEHSGIGLSTSMANYPFNCPWDSGTVGFVVVTKADIRNNWNIKYVTKKYIDHAEQLAIGEIETLSQYANGEIYGFTIEDEDGNLVDSCGGFYGSDVEENGMADYLSDEAIKLLS